MRKRFALAAFVLAASAGGAALAQEPLRPDGLRGYVGAEYGNTRLYDAAGRSSAKSYGVGGAIDLPLRGSIGAQVDFKATKYDFPVGNQWVASPTLHLYARNPYGRVGGFIGATRASGVDAWGAGVEAEAYFTGASLYGSIGYGRVSDLSDTRLWSYRGEGRLFLTENLRVSAGLGYIDAKSRNSSDHGYTASLGAEYRFANAPFSIVAGYQHGKLSRADIKSDAFRVGVRWALSGETLAERDQTGASFDNIFDLFGGPVTEAVYGASVP